MRAFDVGLGVSLRGRRGSGVPGGPTFSFRSNKGVNTSQPTYFDPSKAYLNMARMGGHGARTVGATTYRFGRWVPVGPSPTFTFDASIEHGVNSDGYPTSMATASELLYYVATVESLHPSGDYVLKWAGSPTVAIDSLTSTHTVTSSTSNRIEFEWDGTQLVISLTAVGSPVMSNLIICRAEDEAAIDAGELFRDEYLAMLSGIATTQGLAAVRTMDLTNTNYTADSTTLRPETYISWSEAPPAVCAKLAVALGAALWWCCPHKADATYMANAAAAIFAVLDGTSSDAGVEFGNEVWNSQFACYAFGVSAGAALGSTDSEKLFRWQAQQSLALWAAFEAAGFTPGTDQWNIFGGQSANGNAFTIGCPYNDPTNGRVQDHWHFGTVACYVAFNVDSSTKTSYVLGVSPVEDLFNTYSGGAIPHLGAALATLETDLAARISEIDTYGGHCICYEGGQHAVGVGSEVNDTSLTALLVSLQEMPEMATLYADLIDMVAASGAWFVCWFTACDTPDKFGAWGLCEDPLDTPLASNYTKYGAVAGHVPAGVDNPDAQWWTETPPAPGAEKLVQTLESAPSHVYCLAMLLNGDYTGPLATVIRSSDSATMDVYPDVDGYFDKAAVDAWATTGDVLLSIKKDQSGVNHITYPSGHRPVLRSGATWAALGSANMLGVVGNGTTANATTGGYYGDTTSNITLGADSGVYVLYHRQSTSTSVELIGPQNKFQNGAGYPGQWAADPGIWHQDLTSASASTSDTADRCGSTETAVGMKGVLGRRNTAARSQLFLNGTQLGSDRTSIAAAGPIFSRLGGGTFNVLGGSLLAVIVWPSIEPTTTDIATIETWRSTNFPT